MRDFFKPRGRKVGCVTLVMACVLMAGWVRSNGVEEGVSFRPYNAAYGVFHSSRTIVFFQNSSANGSRFQWWSYELNPDPGLPGSVPPTPMDIDVLLIPYWSIVLPLTLLSAYLLLGKSRSTKPIVPTEPDHA